MKKSILILWILLVSVLSAYAQKKQFTVMTWNILHGANDIENGKDNALRIIKEIDPDIILMVETYGSGEYIANTLGYNFHLIAPEGIPLDDKSTNLSIFSKFPFGQRIDTKHPFFLGGREILVYGKKIRFFSNWFHYLPWHDQPEKMGKSVEELLAWERTESRYEMIQKVLPYFEKYAQETDTVPMILGGDMNTPSHKDWGEETKELHNNLIVPWYSTRVLEKLGLIDSFRKENPSPNSHPGITWNVKGRDDSHRIDYIFYKGNSINSIKSTSYMAYFNEVLKINSEEILYPSDHGIVVTTFEIK